MHVMKSQECSVFSSSSQTIKNKIKYDPVNAVSSILSVIYYKAARNYAEGKSVELNAFIDKVGKNTPGERTRV